MIYLSLLISHIKIAFRSLLRHPGFSTINIAGLALGMSVFLLILSYTSYQDSFDRFHPDADRLYRVNQTAIWSSDGGIMGSTPPPLAQVLADDFPEVESTTRINTPGDMKVRYEKGARELIVFQEDHVLAADSNFFEFFAIPLLAGDPDNALAGTNKAVISGDAASRYFGDESPLGKTLLIGKDQMPVEVTGVTGHQPDNMHFHFDFLLSMPTNAGVEEFNWSWIWTQMATYVKLRQDADAIVLEDKLASIEDSYVQSTFARLGMDMEDFMKDKGKWSFYLQPVERIHLYSQDIGNRLGNTGSIQTVQIFRLLAFLVLFIAIINFVNLATARASERGKEVGVKRAMGVSRSNLISQFQTESIVTSLLATLVAIPLLIGLKRLLHVLVGLEIPSFWLSEPKYVGVFLIIPVIVGVIAGIYPSLYLTSFSTVKVLKGTITSNTGNNQLRKVLVTTQFTISLALIAGTMIIFSQLSYLNDKHLGFDRENILVVNYADQLGTDIESFRHEVAATTGVVEASVAMDVPGRGTWEDIFSTEGSDLKLSVAQLKVDEYFVPVMNMKMAEGRAFGENRSIDQYSVVINESLASMFGWTNQEALDHTITYPGHEKPFDIIGVVNDFHFQSLRQDISPLALFHSRSDMWGDQQNVVVKFQQQSLSAVIASIEESWDVRSAGTPLSYSILDEELNNLYDEEQSLGSLLACFTGLAILIAMLGLIGLVAFSTNRRKKEIGIRKVLGASITRIFLLINRQYLVMIGIAMLISIPATWWMAEQWLANFSYHTNVKWYVFLLSGIVITLISLISVSYLTYSAASANPAEAIQDE